MFHEITIKTNLESSIKINLRCFYENTAFLNHTLLDSKQTQFFLRDLSPQFLV